MIEPKEHVKSLFRTVAFKSSRKKLLRLDMNENPFGLPDDFIKRSLKSLNGVELSMYPEYEALTCSIARHDGVSPENICLSNGSDGAIKYIFDAYISPGDQILMTDPTFAMYPVYCEMFKARQIIVPYGASFDFPYDVFMSKLTSGVRMAVLINPNNPMGSVLSEERLLEIMKKSQKAKILLIVDEAYYYFYSKTAIKEIKKFNNLIVLRTFSKLCGLANVRIGYAASSPAVIENLKKIKPTFDVNGIAVLLAEKLLSRPKIISQAIASTNVGKEYIVKKLREAGILYKDGHANFILIGCGHRVDEIKRKLEKKGILVHGGFRQDFLKSYIRITVADQKRMAFFWKSFREALGGV